MAKLKKPLDPIAVQEADDHFYSHHPELIDANGKRIPLSPTDSKHDGLRREWRATYLRNGGQSEGRFGANPLQPVCIPCQKAAAARQAAAAQEARERKQKGPPIGTLKVHWSKPKVTPDHNLSFPPASPPTDAIPALAKVELIADTTNVPDGTSASMTIYHAATGTAVPNGAFAGLEVRGNKVVADTGKLPEWVFDAAADLWDPWDKPYYYFSCSVDYQSLLEETPKDFVGREADCLRLLYWHECIAETNDLKGVLPECNTVAGLLNAVANSNAHVQDVKFKKVTLPQYGSLLRNTYVVHQASHGNVLNRKDNKGIKADDPGECLYDKGAWRGVVKMTLSPARIGDAQIATALDFPSTPKYLYYASTCLTGWEPSFANAMIARGTRNVIAFRCCIPDSEAPIMAEQFYTRWARTYALNPDKVPECFFKAGADHYARMKPILFGPGIKSKSLLELAAKAVRDVAVGIAHDLKELFR